ncbi:uncharacterized protein [Diadema antillarum]|uniref:uncharacterized protein n=1 Tax=Diadema antillarum TaxID=105358 RepID=UPI003A878983
MAKGKADKSVRQKIPLGHPSPRCESSKGARPRAIERRWPTGGVAYHISAALSIQKQYFGSSGSPRRYSYIADLCRHTPPINAGFSREAPALKSIALPQSVTGHASLKTRGQVSSQTKEVAYLLGLTEFVSNIRFKNVSCYCLPGFDGNGFSCEPINACIPNNPCDASALCVPNGPGTFECLCPPELHRLGRRCFANLAVELEEMDEAEPFWRLIQRSHLIGYLATTNHSVGIIIPPAEAILDLENITEGTLQWEPAAAYFVRSHILSTNHSVQFESESSQNFLSLQPGETITISQPLNDTFVVNTQPSQCSQTVNGFLCVLSVSSSSSFSTSCLKCLLSATIMKGSMLALFEEFVAVL